MGYQIIRTDAEIDEQLNKAGEAYDKGNAGADLVRATIEWLAGETDEPPMGD